jgi:hypothetical protein
MRDVYASSPASSAASSLLLSSARKLGLKRKLWLETYKLHTNKKSEADIPIPVLNLTPSAAGSREQLLPREIRNVKSIMCGTKSNLNVKQLLALKRISQIAIWVHLASSGV